MNQLEIVKQIIELSKSNPEVSALAAQFKEAQLKYELHLETIYADVEMNMDAFDVELTEDQEEEIISSVAQDIENNYDYSSYNEHISYLIDKKVADLINSKLEASEKDLLKENRKIENMQKGDIVQASVKEEDLTYSAVFKIQEITKSESGEIVAKAVFVSKANEEIEGSTIHTIDQSNFEKIVQPLVESV